MSHTSVVARLKNFIVSDGLQCNTFATDDHISAFESKNKIAIPDDFRTYFSEVNGTGAGGYAYGIIRFWSIDEIRKAGKELLAKCRTMEFTSSQYTKPIESGADLFVFADHMHEIQLYAILLSPLPRGNSIFILDGNEPIVVADSFSDFVDRYLTNPEELRLMID